jgi:hypothetical protein
MSLDQIIASVIAHARTSMANSSRAAGAARANADSTMRRVS